VTQAHESRLEKNGVAPESMGRETTLTPPGPHSKASAGKRRSSGIPVPRAGDREGERCGRGCQIGPVGQRVPGKLGWSSEGG
jgi:hypothetical protein